MEIMYNIQYIFTMSIDSIDVVLRIFLIFVIKFRWFLIISLTLYISLAVSLFLFLSISPSLRQLLRCLPASFYPIVHCIDHFQTSYRVLWEREMFVQEIRPLFFSVWLSLTFLTSGNARDSRTDLRAKHALEERLHVTFSSR